MADRWRRLVPLSGVVMVGLVVTVIALTSDQPGASDGARKVAAYYSSHHGRTDTQVVLLAYAALFAIGYFVSVAHYLRSRGAQTMATYTIVGGTLTAIGFGLGAGANAALGEGTGHLSVSALQAVNAVQSDLFWPAMIVGMTVATLAIGVSSLRTKALPKPLAILLVIDGVGGVSGIGSWIAFMLSGLLTLVVAGYVCQRSGAPASISLPDVPSQRDDEVKTSRRRSKATTA